MTDVGAIAVIGMSCRFPASDGVEPFWRNLVDGVECVGEVPRERWDMSRFAGDAPALPGRTYCLKAGMDATADCYDAPFFRIDPDEAKRIDPQQGMMLELAWHACEDAGIAPDALAAAEVGVFVGVSTRDFDRRMANRWDRIDVRTSTGASGAIVANRISYTFGFTGPSVAVDAACASSLASVHLACRSLADGECAVALAGGVQLILSPANIVAFSQGGLLARDGRCKPFSARADGYVCGEGGGAVLLKPLAQAVRDGDRVRAVIRGSAINHNGRSNGLSAPFRAAQQKVMRAALSRAQVPAGSVGYVEAHAPGTPLGDAIELQAIREVYGESRDAASACLVGSVKSNIGHLEAAAGIAAFIKTALAVERGWVPASLNCTPANPMLRLGASSVRLSEALQPWPQAPLPRRAGVSAFSFGGCNAHAIVEQPPAHAAAPAPAPQSGPWLLTLSAASEPALERLRQAYLGQLAQSRSQRPAALGEFCAAALTGRQLLKHRLAVVAGDWDEAIDALRVARPGRVGAGPLRVPLGNARAASDPDWPPLRQRLENLPEQWREPLRSVAFLAALGLTRAGLRAGPARAAALIEAARSLGVGLIDESKADTSALAVVFVDAPADAPADRAHADDARERLRLAAELVLRGVALRWSALAEPGGGRIGLPLYPFERTRNHIVMDDIDPALARAGEAIAPTLESIE